MGRRSRRSSAAHVKQRSNGTFVARRDASMEVPSDAGDCETLDTYHNPSNREEVTELSYFDEWWCKEIGEKADNASKRPMVYRGDTERTKRSKRALINHANIVCPKAPLSSFFTLLTPNMDVLEDALEPRLILTPLECISQLKVLYKKAIKLPGHASIEIIVMLKFFEFRMEGTSRHVSSVQAASCIPKALRRHCRTIENWARSFESSGLLICSRQGRH